MEMNQNHEWFHHAVNTDIYYYKYIAAFELWGIPNNKKVRPSRSPSAGRFTRRLAGRQVSNLESVHGFAGLGGEVTDYKV